MCTHPAAVARTLATGRLLGKAHVRGYRCPLCVRLATGEDGLPLLLVHDHSHLAAALAPTHGETDTSTVVSIDHPRQGRLWLSGWASRLDEHDSRDAALSFASINPLGDLLDVGHDHSLYRLDVAEVRLAHGDTLIDIDVDEYLAAEPILT